MKSLALVKHDMRMLGKKNLAEYRIYGNLSRVPVGTAHWAGAVLHKDDIEHALNQQL